MVKKLKAGRNRLRTVYWSAVGMLSMTLISLQPVLAADKGGGDTIWNRFSTIMKDVYGEIVGISTIVGVTAAAIALIVRMISRNQRAVDEATSWLKRIVITWIVLNSLGFIVAYLQPLIAGGSEMFPDLPEDTMLRTVDEGVLEASTDSGNSLWYSSAFYEEPDAPHGSIQASDGVDWYAMQQHAQTPAFESGEAADAYNQSQFQRFMQGYEQQVSSVDGSRRLEGQIEVQHGDGSGTRFYDTSQYAAPRGDYQVYEDSRGGQWYAIHGEASVDRKPGIRN